MWIKGIDTNKTKDDLRKFWVHGAAVIFNEELSLFLFVEVKKGEAI